MALQQHLSQIYDIARDDANLRAYLKEGKVDQQAFDHLRKTYHYVVRWAAHKVGRRHDNDVSTHL